MIYCIKKEAHFRREYAPRKDEPFTPEGTFIKSFNLVKVKNAQSMWRRLYRRFSLVQRDLIHPEFYCTYSYWHASAVLQFAPVLHCNNIDCTLTFFQLLLGSNQCVNVEDWLWIINVDIHSVFFPSALVICIIHPGAIKNSNQNAEKDRTQWKQTTRRKDVWNSSAQKIANKIMPNMDIDCFSEIAVARRITRRYIFFSNFFIIQTLPEYKKPSISAI